jgi:hypothetical protein
MSKMGVRRDKAGAFQWCKSTRQIAPTGSNRSSHGGDEVAEAFDYPIATSALPQDAVNRRVIEPLYSRHRPLWVRPLVIEGSKLKG